MPRPSSVPTDCNRQRCKHVSRSKLSPLPLISLPSFILCQLKEKIEEKQKELKKMISEDEGSRRDVAVSLTYDSSPESSLLVPRKSSTPAVSGVWQSRLSPFSPDKKVSLTPRLLQKFEQTIDLCFTDFLTDG